MTQKVTFKVLSCYAFFRMACHFKMNNRPNLCQTTVKQCQECKMLVAQDAAASCIILDIFKFQWKFQTNLLPPWLYDEENVMNGTIVGTTDSENTSRDLNLKLFLYWFS
jgi:hypothetical protein